MEVSQSGCLKYLALPSFYFRHHGYFLLPVVALKENFSDVSSIIDNLQQVSDELVTELLGMIATFFKSIASIPDKLSSRESLGDLEEMANSAAAAMVLLQPNVDKSATS